MARWLIFDTANNVFLILRTMQSPSLPISLINSAAEELVNAKLVLASVFKITVINIFVAVQHDALALTLAFVPFALISIAVGPYKCAVAVAHAVLRKYYLIWKF